MQLTVKGIQGAAELLGEIDAALLSEASDGFKRFLSTCAIVKDSEIIFVPEQVSRKNQRTNSSTENTYRLCNLVLQGGGVLGLAHVGFLMGLERAGVRFVGLAGTSAGAIVATTTVCIRGSDIERTVSDKLLSLVGSVPMASFIDGPYLTRILIKRVLAKRYPISLQGMRAAFQAWRLILTRRGLNPGDEFEGWLKRTFKTLGVETIEMLENNLQTIHAALLKAKHLAKHSVSINLTACELLQTMSATLPAGIKFTFPRDVACLDPSYRQSSPAILVRASMSIPGFFQPKFFKVDQPKWEAKLKDSLGGLEAQGLIRNLKDIKQAAFVDGGILSNLPVDAFNGLPEIPTLCVSLSSWNSDKNENVKLRKTTKGLISDIVNMVSAIRDQRDRDATELLRKNRNARVELISIDVGNANWLDFNMSQHEKGELFLRGLKQSLQFIRGS